MTAAEIIASGLLEAHVLGQTSASEAALVEMLRRENAEVRAELDSLERALEAMAEHSAKPAPLRTRAAVMNTIEAKDRATVVRMKPATSGGSVKWLAAASVAALFVSGIGNWMLYSKVGTMEQQIAVMQNDRTVLAEQMEVQRTAMEASNAQLAVVLDPHKRMVALGGVGTTLDAKARIFWDEKTNDVYMDVLSLPEPPAGKQYQLWALAGGVPIDAGMFDSKDGAAQVQRMKSIPDAQAFAVTLEAEGGVPSPTLEAMVLLGNV
ncbi:MAG: anti-sigma factor [Flavobacteriales bacterium]|nr:MAG: anti-sigma factor [Flavobacteriales bacterium]